MTRKTLILIAAGGSALMMLGALGFQYIGQMPPCKLCYWQRYPHVAAIVIGLIALWRPGRQLPAAGALAALTTAAIGVYHTGVERKWWLGPESCSSQPITGLSTDDLLSQIMTSPVVRCDEPPFVLLGLSMASWNVIASVGLALIWVQAVRRS